MGTVRERTQKEIEEFIRLNSEDGKLNKSLLDIAEKIGYSNATVHRALKALESKGLIQIEAAKKPTEPNTIIFKGDTNDIDEFLSKGVQLSNNFEMNMQELEDYIQRTQTLIRQLREENERLKQNQGEIVNVAKLPDTDIELVTLRRKSQARDESKETAGT